MNKNNCLKTLVVIAGLSLSTICCDQPATEKSFETKTDTAMVAMAVKPDMNELKATIQALETEWSIADNARDANALAAFYSDDAVSLATNRPMLVGKEAIRKDLEESLAKKPKGATVTYDVLDVFGGSDLVTEVGKTTNKDSTGKVYSTGKYMAIWEKRAGKFICIRDISNDDVKAK